MNDVKHRCGWTGDYKSIVMIEVIHLNSYSAINSSVRGNINMNGDCDCAEMICQSGRDSGPAVLFDNNSIRTGCAILIVVVMVSNFMAACSIFNC